MTEKTGSSPAWRPVQNDIRWEVCQPRLRFLRVMWRNRRGGTSCLPDRIKIRIKVKSDGQECLSHTSKTAAGRSSFLIGLSARFARVRQLGRLTPVA